MNAIIGFAEIIDGQMLGPADRHYRTRAAEIVGQARLLLARAAAAAPAVVPVLPEGSPVPAEDALAFFRDHDAFRNVRLVEPDNGDFAVTMVRLLVFSVWRLALLERLRSSRDPVLAAIAAKEMVNAAFELPLAQGIRFERRLFHGLFGTEDQKEGMAAFVDKRPGKWTRK